MPPLLYTLWLLENFYFPQKKTVLRKIIHSYRVAVNLSRTSLSDCGMREVTTTTNLICLCENVFIIICVLELFFRRVNSSREITEKVHVCVCVCVRKCVKSPRCKKEKAQKATFHQVHTLACESPSSHHSCCLFFCFLTLEIVTNLRNKFSICFRPKKTFIFIFLSLTLSLSLYLSLPPSLSMIFLCACVLQRFYIMTSSA